MNKKSSAGLVVAITMAAIIVPSQAAWACHKHHKHHTHYAHYKNCTGQGWHMVSKSCDIKPAATWQAYWSGVYTQPMENNDMYMR